MTEFPKNTKLFYAALVRKDPAFEGQFIAAVKTTGIFCRPTCTARKPKIDNVEFFATAQGALTNGYRPCKICKPLESAGEVPEEIKSLLLELDIHPQDKISDYALSQRGIEPNRIRRWFQRNHGMTFQAYQRLLRINGALKQIKSGAKVIDAAFDSGYESLSGFNHSFKRATSKKPNESRDAACLTFLRFATPIGPMITVATEEGIGLFRVY